MDSWLYWGHLLVLYSYDEIAKWFLAVNLLTWTGIGTTIRLPVPPMFLLKRPEEPVLTRFHLARLFWNQIFTCTSESFSPEAICDLSSTVRYFFVWNSRSSSSSCWLVNAVRRRRCFKQPSIDSSLLKYSLSFCSTTSLNLSKLAAINKVNNYVYCLRLNYNFVFWYTNMGARHNYTVISINRDVAFRRG